MLAAATNKSTIWLDLLGQFADDPTMTFACIRAPSEFDDALVAPAVFDCFPILHSNPAFWMKAIRS